MSKHEHGFSNRHFSIGSERELDDLNKAPSEVSDDREAAKQKSLTMADMYDHDDNDSFLDGAMFHPGTTRPPHHPHHHHGESGQVGDKHDKGEMAKDNSEKSHQPTSKSSDEKKGRTFNQWNIDVSEGSDSSPRHGSPAKTSKLPEVEIVKPEEDLPKRTTEDSSSASGISRGPRYSSQRSYSDMMDNMSGNDPFGGEYQPSGKVKPSKIPKKKKHKHDKRDHSEDSIPLEAVVKPADQEPKKLKKRRSRHHHHQGSESLNSNATYTLEGGVVNDGFEESGKSKRKGSNQGNKIVEDRISNATFTVSDVEQDSFALKESYNRIIKKFKTVKTPAKEKKLYSSSLNERTVARYISKHIQQRECNKYARNKDSPTNACQCGRTKAWHEENYIEAKHNTERDIWAMKTHTRAMPCDSFGEILFRGFGHDVSNSPYVRLDTITDLEDIWTILTELWDLPIPKLLISVTGGAKRFDLKPRLRNLLKEGLCHAATSTGAWIITGGTSAGVMEFVGEAVKDHIAATGSSGQHDVVALGIATWGIVANKLSLDGEGDRGLFPATYAVEDVDILERGSAALDHNHTHFILVDDGTEGKYGSEIKLRTKLESYISQKVETGVAESQSVHVPNVLIVVEGGVNTMKTVSESIQRRTPVVVVEGSGRAADYIALGYRLTKGRDDEDKSVWPPDFDSLMLSKARSMFVWKKTDQNLEKKLNECVRHLKEVLTQRRLVNVFNLEAADTNKDIDRAILYALLKANKSNANSQLALALAWNRCDIARQEIFSHSNRKYWKDANLYDAMVTALVQDRADFVQLFLDNGLDIKRFLTIKTLWNLYANVINDMGDIQAELIRNLLAYHKQTWAAYLCCQGTTRWQQSSDLLRYIGKVIMHLLRDQAMYLYSADKYEVVQKDGPTLSWLGDKEKVQPLLKRISTQDGGDGSLSHRRKFKIKETFDFNNPERELFLWAVLFNRRQMAQLFWRIGKDHLMSGLVACSLLKMMSETADDEEELELAADLQDHAQVFEKQSFDVLSECYSRDKRQTHQLLVCEQREWGGNTIFTTADTHTLMDFMENTACQTKLNDIWKGRMALYTPEYKILLTIILPILLPFIKFTSNTTVTDMMEGEDSDEEEYVDAVNSPGRHIESSGKPNQVDPHHDDEEPEFTPAMSRRKKRSKKKKLYSITLTDWSSSTINIITAIFYFYAAPVTKFYCNVGSYLAFLFIFSYFVLIDLKPIYESNSPSIYEILTWLWFATMVLEEGRQVFISDQRSFIFKIQSWFNSIWNRFDLIIYTLFVISIILRYNLFTDNFLWARMSYSITLAFFYLRFMQFFFASKNMGPKVIMIRKMLTDLLFFFFILLVFVISFGVAYHVNMYPNHVANYKILVNVLYLPYWQMYGELFLERIEGEDDPNDCTRNETLWRNDLAPRCPESNALVTILLAVYMILTNILLVNLLIAMFSYTFQTVQDNSQKIWRFYRLSLVYEYFDRPTLVPPIIVLNHIYRAFRWCFSQTCQSCTKTNDFKARLEEKEYVRLRIFEKVAMESYLSRSRMLRKEQLDSRVATTADRIESVMYELALIKETVMEPGGRRGLTEEQAQQLAALGNVGDPVVPAAHRPSTGETAYLRQCVDDLTEQMGQQTLRLSQVMHLVEQLVSTQPSARESRHSGSQKKSESSHHSQHGRDSQANLQGLTISEISPREEDV